VTERTSRRKWLSSLLPMAVDGASSLVEAKIERRLPARRRPPGAVGEALFLTLCTRCDACVEACPHLAVHKLNPETGVAAGTPVMRPAQRPCFMCEGFPCAAACEEGALEVPRGAVWPLGKVHLDLDLCLTTKGPECGACARLCPPGVSAIAMAGLQPRLDQEACVGCGRCVEACPTTPKAITLLPYERVTLPVAASERAER
jgi:ferredoxin-type protein NapF